MGQKSKSKIIRKKKDAKKKKASKNQKEPRTWKQFFFRFSFFVFFCVIVYVFLCSNLVRVNHFEVQGIDDLSEERILNTTRSVLEGEFYKYFKKDNYFLVDVKSVKQEVMQDKRIKDVAVEKKFPQTMIIKITKHKVIPVWCTDESKNECFMLEENIVANKVDINDDIILHNRHFVVVNEGIQTIENGQRIMAEEYFSKIEILGEELTYVLNAEIKQPYVIASRGSHEVRFVTDEGWYLVVDLTHDVEEILNVAKLFTKKIDLPSSRYDLEYIDMRFPEKIFYKMKDGVEKISEDETEDGEQEEEVNEELKNKN